MSDALPLSLPAGVQVLGRHDAYATVLTAEALAFIADLTRTFAGRVENLLEERKSTQARLDAGEKLDFLSATAAIRSDAWRCAALPDDLLDRRVEITGPPVRKMVVNALNSGANVFMADFEDSCAPTWDNLLTGQLNLIDAVRCTLQFTDPQTGKHYKLGTQLATLVVRPRGWHLFETHLRVDDTPVPGALLDFGLYLFHNAKALLERGTGPYFYLPKLQSHREARLWNDVFTHAQRCLNIPPQSIRATVLIETLPAAFQMDEIIYELRQHIAGLNCGRWDYIFSFIKTRRTDPHAVLPDRRQVGMTQPCMRAYSQLLIRTCHRRGIHAMGGMAAQVPIRDDEAANRVALEKVQADKLREVQDGHDGTWVAHPGLVTLARKVFDEYMPQPNQLASMRDDVQVLADDLLRVPAGACTVDGLRYNIEVGVQYLEAWLGGNGCVPIAHLMEDAATAEISRSQLWQWLHHNVTLEDGTRVTAEFCKAVIAEEIDKLHQKLGAERFATGHFQRARELFERLTLSEELCDFLTIPASGYLHSTSMNA